MSGSRATATRSGSAPIGGSGAGGLTVLSKLPHVMFFGGGVVIKIGDEVVGAIGVSGGHYTQDMEVAQAGLAVLG